MLNPTYFVALDILWGPPHGRSILVLHDRQIPRFCSRWLNPSTEAVDAFTVSWREENNWVFPPPFLIAKVISHMHNNHEDGTVIVPLLTSALWWPLLTLDGHQPVPWIVDWLDIPLSDNTFIPAVAHASLFGIGTPSYRVLVLKVCVSHPREEDVTKPFI